MTNMPQITPASSRSVLITGCSSGIGLASAVVLKHRGWRVLATARKPEDLARLRQLGFDALPLELTDPKSIEACATEALRLTGGKLTALVNKTGRIVQVSSVLGLMAAPYRGAYCASKFALEGLTDSLRMELHGTGIRVSIIEPGPVRTKFLETALAAFKANIDLTGSVHKDVYARRIGSMESGGKSTFKVEPEEVAKRVILAVEGANPKPRYFVTVPTHAANILKRALPTVILDRFARSQ
jgi:NAD(P)-dependent dehydrogenase (short-subunit alcohol dehydrogenase family)